MPNADVRRNFIASGMEVHTQGSRQTPEDQAIGVLEKANPLHTCSLPLFYNPGRMQESVHITVAVWLGLQGEGVVPLQRQPGL